MKKCKKCGAPLEGFLYNTIGKLMGIKPSEQDPEICNKCIEEKSTPEGTEERPTEASTVASEDAWAKKEESTSQQEMATTSEPELPAEEKEPQADNSNAQPETKDTEN